MQVIKVHLLNGRTAKGLYIQNEDIALSSTLYCRRREEESVLIYRSDSWERNS